MTTYEVSPFHARTFRERMFAKVEAQGHKFLSAIKEEVQVSRKSACGSVALEVLSFEEERIWTDVVFSRV